MRMLMIISILSIPLLNVEAKEFFVKNVINEDSDCRNAGGNEVNSTVNIAAPPGMFFGKETLSAYGEPDMRSYTDAAGPSGCFVRNIKTSILPVVTKSGHTIDYTFVTSFDVYGHSDCGSGTMQAMLGHRIRTDCSAKAQIFSLDDLK